MRSRYLFIGIFPRFHGLVWRYSVCCYCWFSAPLPSYKSILIRSERTHLQHLKHFPTRVHPPVFSVQCFFFLVSTSFLFLLCICYVCGFCTILVKKIELFTNSTAFRFSNLAVCFWEPLDKLNLYVVHDWKIYIDDFYLNAIFVCIYKPYWWVRMTAVLNLYAEKEFVDEIRGIIIGWESFMYMSTLNNQKVKRKPWH